jgi:large subunit ribosomal protein L15e
LWYEVILVDPFHPAIFKDKEMRGKLRAFAK